MGLETDLVDQLCLEVDETTERTIQDIEKALATQPSTVDNLLNAYPFEGCVEAHTEYEVCRPQRRYQGTDDCFEGQQE